MFRKILISMLIPVLLAGTVSGSVLAAGTTPVADKGGRRRVAGTVTAVNTEGFSVDPFRGEEIYFLVDEYTRFRNGSFADLKAGIKVAVAYRGEEEPAALIVGILPPEFEPGGRFEIRARGEVIDVNVRAGKFRIQTPEGDLVTFFVDEGTRYGGQLEKLTDLQIGWKAAAAGERKGSGEGDGKVVASIVIAGELPERIKMRGTVSAVDLEAGRFRLERPEGAPVMFFVDENTRYGGRLEDLADLRVGWAAGVVGKEVEDGMLAVGVIAAERPIGQQIRGEVKEVDSQGGTFRMETTEGNQLTLFVHEDTRYGGQLDDLADLRVGWIAGVGVVEGPQGKLQALWVVAGNPEQLVKARGEITAVDLRARKFRLRTPGGNTMIFSVSERTHYRGQADALKDVQVGWKAGVVAVEGGDGMLHAQLVIAGDPQEVRREGPQNPSSSGWRHGLSAVEDPFRAPPDG